MCEAINLSYNTYNSMLKRQSTSISLDTIKDIARYFDVSLDYLIIDEITDPGYSKQDIQHNVLIISDSEDINIIKKFQMLTPRNKYRVESKIDDYINEQKTEEFKKDTEFAKELA